MIVDNLRYGFATNSSSTHSLAIWKGEGPIPTEPEPDTFGWEWFTANTADSKGAYLRSLFMEDAARVVGGESAVHMASILWGADRERLAVEFHGVNVDHDSNPYLPRTWDGKFPNMDFTMEFHRMLQNPRIAILGGNDNEEDPGAFHPGYSTLDRMGGLFGGYGRGVARRDPTYGHWTIFSRENGKKVRIRLDETLSSNAERSTVPELVDMKITDYCPFSCEFCAVAGTPIETESGTEPIEAIKKGDLVLTYKESDGSYSYGKVEETYAREFDGELIDITMENGCTMSLTPEHPVLTTNRGWVLAGDLNESDILLDSPIL